MKINKMKMIGEMTIRLNVRVRKVVCNDGKEIIFLVQNFLKKFFQKLHNSLEVILNNC